MNKLEKKEMLIIKGGAAVTGAMINALIRTVSVMYNIGQAVGSAVRRIVGKNYC